MNVEQYKGMDLATSIFGMYLVDNTTEQDNYHVLTADMSVASCLERIKLQMPERYTDVGIAEQNMVGIAAGLAAEGFHPIAICQAVFITMRAFEMDRQFLGYMKNNVVLVGLHAGFFLQFMGNTHYAIEDMAIMRTIPGMTVLSPADAGEAVACMDVALKHDGPVYIRLTGGSMAPTVFEEDCEVVIGMNKVVREGKDITIFATGAMVGNSLKAAEILEEQNGIDAKVVDVCSIKPLDKDSINESKTSKLIASVEEHNVVGGLGSAIADYMAEEGGFAPIIKLGVQDQFGEVGDYQYQLDYHGLTPEKIAVSIYNKLNSFNL